MNFLILTGMILAWAIGFQFIGLTYEIFNDNEIVFISHGLAALVILVLSRGRSLMIPEKRHILLFLGVVLGSLTVYNILLITGVGMLPPQIQGTLGSFCVNTTPLFVFLISWAALKQKFPRLVWVGVLIAIIGLALISGLGATFHSGILFIVLGAFFYGVSIFLQNKISGMYTPLQIAGTGMLCSALLIVVYDPSVIGAIPKMQNISHISVQSLLFLSLIATAYGYWAWAYIIKKFDEVTVGNVLFAVPVVSSIAGALFFGQSLSMIQWFGCGLVLCGVFVIHQYLGNKSDV